jgi:diketogulonate reductase-like aldo/keto reductase
MAFRVVYRKHVKMVVFRFWKVPKDKPTEVCYQAILAGYRKQGYSCDHGNEKVGQGIAKASKKGICNREPLTVTSKLWNTYCKSEYVPLALEHTLKDPHLTYLDEYLVILLLHLSSFHSMSGTLPTGPTAQER